MQLHFKQKICRTDFKTTGLRPGPGLLHPGSQPFASLLLPAPAGLRAAAGLWLSPGRDYPRAARRYLHIFSPADGSPPLLRKPGCKEQCTGSSRKAVIKEQRCRAEFRYEGTGMKKRVQKNQPGRTDPQPRVHQVIILLLSTRQNELSGKNTIYLKPQPEPEIMDQGRV